MASLGTKMKELRKRRKMTQLDLCEGLVTASMISQIESGRAMPSIILLEQLATRLEVDIHYFEDEVSNRSDQQQMYRKARSLMSAERWEEALPILLEMSEMMMFQFRVESIYSDLTQCYEKLNRPSEACDMLESVLQIAYEKEDIAGAVHAYSELGQIERKRRRYSIAQMYWQRACDLLDRHPEFIMPIAQKLHGNLGRLYLDSNQILLAQKSFETAYSLALQSPNPKEIGVFLQGLTVTSIMANDFEKATEYNKLAMSAFLESKNQRGVNKCRTNNGYILRATGHLTEAVEELTSFIHSKHAESDVIQLANAYDERAQSLLELKEFDQALEDANRALTLDTSTPQLQCEMHRVRAQAFLQQGKVLNGLEETRIGMEWIEQVVLSRKELLRAQLQTIERECYTILGHVDKAIEHSILYAKAIIHDPKATPTPEVFPCK